MMLAIMVVRGEISSKPVSGRVCPAATPTVLTKVARTKLGNAGG